MPADGVVPANAIYSACSGLYTHSLIHVKKGLGNIAIESSTFSHNGGTKGPIMSELGSTGQAHLVLNTFNYNTGLYSAGALSLFSEASSSQLSG